MFGAISDVQERRALLAALRLLLDRFSAASAAPLYLSLRLSSGLEQEH